MQNVQKIVDCIHQQRPFDCDNLDELCTAITTAYSTSWSLSLVWILGCVRKMRHHKDQVGSWNIPMWWVRPDVDVNPYKVFRRPTKTSELVYEFHKDTVPLNKWVEAELSGSEGLTGLSSKEFAKFHFFLNSLQAASYLDIRKDCVAYTDHEPVILPVKGKNYLTVDLIYVPPTRFVWGIDAKEMHVNYEQPT